MSNRIRFFLLITLSVLLLISCKNKGDDTEMLDEQITSASRIETREGDIIELVDEYEKFIIEYVALLEKIQEGDAPSAARLQEEHIEFLKWVETFQSLESELTDSLRTRLVQLNKKLDEILSE